MSEHRPNIYVTPWLWVLPLAFAIGVFHNQVIAPVMNQLFPQWEFVAPITGLTISLLIGELGFIYTKGYGLWACVSRMNHDKFLFIVAYASFLLSVSLFNQILVFFNFAGLIAIAVFNLIMFVLFYKLGSAQMKEGLRRLMTTSSSRA